MKDIEEIHYLSGTGCFRPDFHEIIYFTQNFHSDQNAKKQIIITNFYYTFYLLY